MLQDLCFQTNSWEVVYSQDLRMPPQDSSCHLNIQSLNETAQQLDSRDRGAPCERQLSPFPCRHLFPPAPPAILPSRRAAASRLMSEPDKCEGSSGGGRVSACTLRVTQVCMCACVENRKGVLNLLKFFSFCVLPVISQRWKLARRGMSRAQCHVRDRYTLCWSGKSGSNYKKEKKKAA